MKLIYCILFALSAIPTLYSQQQFSVYFDSDQYDPTPMEVKKLTDWLSANQTAKIVGVHGFTDEDGTNGHNDTLANKRISTILSLIRNKIKIRDDFKTRSFGELHQHSKIKAENRKVTLYYIEAKDFPRENEILKIKSEEKPVLVKAPVHYPDKIRIENPDGSKSEFALDTAFMYKVAEAQIGEKLKLDNLNFQINTFIVVPASRGKMYELLLVMQNNPNIKIEIHGHLCCQPVDRLDLSTQRAKAIKNFLVSKGIAEGRITYKGFGSSQPIFPLPEKDEPQRAANRRVEIMIVAN